MAWPKASAPQQAVNRAGAPTKRPFADVRTDGPDIGYYLSPYGGLGLMFSNGL